MKFDYDEILKDTVSKMDGVNINDYEQDKGSAGKYIILTFVLVALGAVLYFFLLGS